MPTSKREPLMIIAELVGPLMSAISIDSYLFEWAVQASGGPLCSIPVPAPPPTPDCRVWLGVGVVHLVGVVVPVPL